MAVTLHIRSTPAISELDWEAFVDADPRMGLQTGFDLGPIHIPGTFAGPLRNGRILPVFSWSAGEISFKFRALGDDLIFQLVADICARLGAFIEDDDGEQFDLTTDGLTSR